MAKSSLLNHLYLACFSKPSHERIIHREIRRLRARSIVELGVGMGRRSMRMIGTALRYASDQEIRYTGVDLFEARASSCPGMTLKGAYRILRECGVKAQLIPGDPFSALARNANQLQNTDLVVIGADQDVVSLSKAWFFLPRMMTAQTTVFLESFDDRHNKPQFHRLQHQEVVKLAAFAKHQGQRAA